MKTIIEKEPIYKEIKTVIGTKDKTVYVSDDGKQKSIDKNAIISYEYYIKYEKIEKRYSRFDISISDGFWYLAKNEEEFALAISHYNEARDIYLNTVRIPHVSSITPIINEWFFIHHPDVDSYSAYVYTYEFVKECIQKNIFDELEKKT